MKNETPLTRETIERAFDQIGYMAREIGATVDVAVYGGSCLILATDSRQVTRDVDAVFLSDRSLGYSLADSVGRKLGLPDGWLNQAVKAYAPPKGNPEPNLIPYGDYPRSGGVPGLRVFLPTPEYMLAMKLIAARGDDMDAAQRDMSDIHALMQVTGLVAVDDLVSLVEKCYPSLHGIHERVRLKIEDLVESYDPEGNVTSWNAGRGSPTR